MTQISHEESDIEEPEPSTYFSSQVSDFDGEFGYIDLSSAPDRFCYFGLEYTFELSFKNSPEQPYTNTLLFENIVIEYKDFADKEESYVYGPNKTVQITYLQSYVSVGIPTDRYNWLLKSMNNVRPYSAEAFELYSYQDKNYTWLSALLKDDYQPYIPQCYVYNEVSKNTRAIGNVHDVLLGLKSNVKGYGQFRVRKAHNCWNKLVVSLLLTGFQMTDLTTDQSPPKPLVVQPPSDGLLKALDNLKL